MWFIVLTRGALGTDLIGPFHNQHLAKAYAKMQDHEGCWGSLPSWIIRQALDPNAHPIQAKTE